MTDQWSDWFLSTPQNWISFAETLNWHKNGFRALAQGSVKQ